MADDQAPNREPTAKMGDDGSEAVDAQTRAERELGLDSPPNATPRSAQVRKLGEAAVAAGWRREAAERIAPRVAGSTPVSGEEIRAVLGLLFLAMSSSYLVKTLLTAVRHPDAAQHPSPRHGARKWRRTMAVPLAGANKGWRRAVTDRVTPRMATTTPLEEQQARALLGAGFLALSSYYVSNSLRRFVRMESRGA